MVEPAEKTGMRNAWGRVAESYDEFWAERTVDYTEHGLDLLAPDPGARCLDVGCGPGHTTVALARRLDGGSALGVDFAPSMVEMAKERWAGVTGVEFALDDAEHLDQPDGVYDIVTSTFALMYCYDALAAIGNWQRVLRPGGRLMSVVWGAHNRVWWSPVIDIIESRASYYSSVCPMMFFYGMPGVLARMVEQMGLEVEGTTTVTTPMVFADVDEAVRAAILAGPLAGLFTNRLDEAAQTEAWAEMERHVASVAEPVTDGIALPSETSVLLARRPR